MTLPMVCARLWRYLIAPACGSGRRGERPIRPSLEWRTGQLVLAGGVRAAVRQRARLRPWPGPVIGVSLSTRRRDHVSVGWVSGRVFRALPASRARSVESVLVRSVCVGVLLLLSTDLEAFESQARGLVDRWQIYFGVRCCLRQSIVDVCSGTPTPGRQLTLADGVLGFVGRSALHGLTVHWVMGCLQPATFLVAPRALWRILRVFCPNFISLCGTCSTARGVGSCGTGRWSALTG